MARERAITQVCAVVDESGSMASAAHETTQGYKDFLGTLQETPADVRVSLTIFDSKYRHPYESEYLARAEGLNHESVNYNPACGGGTALYDALGDAVERHEKRAVEVRAIVVIITDGEDNESTRFDKAKIARIVKEKEATGRWQFIWLGPTGSRTAKDIGIQASNTFSLTNGTAGIRAAIAQVAERTQQLLLTANAGESA